MFERKPQCDILGNDWTAEKMELPVQNRSAGAGSGAPLTCPQRRKFLVQMTSCLMSSPNEVPLVVAQWAAGTIGKAMGQPRMRASVGLRQALLSPSGGEFDDVMLALPLIPRPSLQNLSDVLYLINGFLSLRGGPSQAQLAQLSAASATLLKRPAPYAAWTVPLGTCFIAAGYCPIFAGGWGETFVAGLLATLLSVLGFWQRLSSNYDNLLYVPAAPNAKTNASAALPLCYFGDSHTIHARTRAHTLARTPAPAHTFINRVHLLPKRTA